MALGVKNMPANAEDIRDIGLIPVREDPLEEGIATHSSILAWRILCTEEPELKIHICETSSSPVFIVPTTVFCEHFK